MEHNMNASKEESLLFRTVLRLHTAVRDAEYALDSGLLTTAEVVSVAKPLLTAIKEAATALEELIYCSPQPKEAVPALEELEQLT
jgi:hypothetical protein